MIPQPQQSVDRSSCSGRLHGTMSAYTSYGCRCPDAREVARLYRKRLREGRQPSAWVDSTGTNRRIRALQAIGWPAQELSRLLGHRKPSRSMVSSRMCRTQCRRDFAQRVACLYEELRHIPGPSLTAAIRAQRSGYAPPPAWGRGTIDDPQAQPQHVDAMQLLLVDSTGSRRRIRALQAIGWPKTELARQLGWQDGRVLDTVLAANRMHCKQAAAIRRLYDELSMTLGPSDDARRWAQAVGYPPPLAWDDTALDDPAGRPDFGRPHRRRRTHLDLIAVEEACAGMDSSRQLTVAERIHAIRQLTDQKLSAPVIAQRIGCTPRTVQRHRQRLRNNYEKESA